MIPLLGPLLSDVFKKSVVDQKKKIVSLGKGNLGEIKDRLCYPKFKVSSFFTENLG